MLNKLYLCALLTFFISSSIVYGQNSKSSTTVRLENTTWKVYSRSDRSNDWSEDNMSVHFLPNRVAELIYPSGYKINCHKWRLVGQKLYMESVDSDVVCSTDMRELDVLVKGKTMTGTAELGMNPRPFYVRLVRIR